VENWLNNADNEQLFLSVISLGEIFKGLTILPESKRRQQLQQWVEETLRPWQRRQRSTRRSRRRNSGGTAQPLSL